MGITIALPLEKALKQDTNAARLTINLQHGTGHAKSSGLARVDQLSLPQKADRVNTKTQHIKWQ